jgi:hypothetical protein
MAQVAPDPSLTIKKTEESRPDRHPPKETLGQRAWRFFRMEPSHSVFTDEKVLNRSLSVLQWACFIDQCVGSILQPNFPFLAMTKPDFGKVAPLDTSTPLNSIPPSPLHTIFASLPNRH